MSTLDKFKQAWNTDAPRPAAGPPVDHAGLLAISKARGARQVNRAIQYFWASLTLQIIVYAMLSHLFIRFWGIGAVQGLCLAGGLLYLPFTIMLLRQFKRVARAGAVPPAGGASLQARIRQQYESLRAFYRFKTRYEYLLIPLSAALGVWLTFWVYVPGGVLQHAAGAALTYLLTLLSCGWAIRRENRAHFEQPLQKLHDLLEEFGQ